MNYKIYSDFSIDNSNRMLLHVLASQSVSELVILNFGIQLKCRKITSTIREAFKNYLADFFH